MNIISRLLPMALLCCATVNVMYGASDSTMESRSALRNVNCNAIYSSTLCDSIYDKDIDQWIHTGATNRPIYLGKASPRSIFDRERDRMEVFTHDFVNRLSKSTTDIPTGEWRNTIYLCIVVDTVGNIVKAGIFGKSESEYDQFDREVVRVLWRMVNWIPAKVYDRPVFFRILSTIRLSWQ